MGQKLIWALETTLTFYICKHNASIPYPAAAAAIAKPVFHHLQKSIHQMTLSIRNAWREDCKMILQFVQELALFEESADSCLATLEKLESTLGFTGTQYAKAVVAYILNEEQKEVIVGTAIYFHNYSTWYAASGIYLEDLYIDPSYRGRGYGTTILKYLAQEVKKIGGKRLEWCVLKRNQKAIDVYTGKTVNAEIMNDWQTCRVEGEKLDKLASAYKDKAAS